jgi:hypothetical protein
MFLYARTLQRRAETEYEEGSSSAQAAQLERLSSELTQAVRGAEAERGLEKARKAKRDANSLKIYAQQQRGEADGSAAMAYESARAHIAQSL